jgi:hypothetical protein
MTDIDLKIPIILEMVYPMRWLDEPAEGDVEGRTNREIQVEVYFKPPCRIAPS